MRFVYDAGEGKGSKMKKISIVVMIFCFILTASLPASVFGKNNHSKKISYRHHSDVIGSVLCENGEPASRALVYLVGESYMARTDDEGRFRLHAVPPGNYDLEIETAEIIYGPIAVDVHKKRKVDLDEIPVECTQSEPEPEPSVECQDASECTDNEYCARNDSECGSVGACTPVPSDCTTAEYNPVCGCDWQTYDNACLAQQAGVSVRSNGACSFY